MRPGSVLMLLVALTQAGCSFVCYGMQNAISAPYDAAQECAFRCRVRHAARAAWRQIPKEDGHEYSAAYVKGFEDGFVDYVDAAGTGEPPAIPPIHLRRTLLRSEESQPSIEDWYAGFRHGAGVARESGLRERAVLPVGLPPRAASEAVSAQVVVPIPVEDQLRIAPKLKTSP